MTLLDFTNKVYAKEIKERKPSDVIIRAMLYYAYPFFFETQWTLLWWYIDKSCCQQNGTKYFGNILELFVN